LQLEVWAKERELAGMRASVNTINSEVQRLQKMCEERRDAEESLQEKWKKIEEFDARRVELESIYTALLRANMVLFLQAFLRKSRYLNIIPSHRCTCI
jgi:hypothetical protein